MFSLLYKLASLSLDYLYAGHKVKEKDNLCPEEEFFRERRFKGEVTSINAYEEYGLIDKEVYYSFDVVYANRELFVGDIVLVKASRKEKHHSWIATYVEYDHGDNAKRRKLKSDTARDSNSRTASKNRMNQSSLLKPPLDPAVPNSDMSRVEEIDQIVSECHPHSGKTKDGLEFFVEDCEVDFVPIVGDVIRARVQYTDQGREVSSWRPKEIKCMEGEVTAFENECGVIDDEIIFFRKSCRRNVRLRVGLRVSAMIAASRQGLFAWRAFSLSSSSCEDDAQPDQKPCLTHRDGVDVTEPLSFDSIPLGKENDLHVALQNNSSETLNFLDCYFQNKNKVFYIGKNVHGRQSIPEGDSVDLTIHCKTEAIGQHEDFLYLEFSDFIIKRPVSVTVVDPMEIMLKPTAPYTRVNNNKPNHLDSENFVIIPGRKPYKPVSHFGNKLPPSNIPKPLLKACQNREDISNLIPCVFQNLTMRNYVAKFSTLLHLEEIQVRSDMKKFDLSEAVLQKKGEFLSLKVEGLAEGRPSLIVGDKAILVPPYQRSSFAFEGCIHEVHLNEILLKFSDSFHNSYGGESYDVRFELNRTNFRRLHQCVHHVSENHEYAIFPNALTIRQPLIDVGLVSTQNQGGYNKRQKCHSSRNKISVQWKNSKLNWKQKEAVQRILESRCRPLPYIIFGPPGTGKTITLVEAVLQVYQHISESRIIICTPSNSAADLVAQRIIESDLIGVNEMVRLNSYQRCVESIPEFIRPYCQDKDSLDHVTQYRIIISTCSTAGSLYTIGLCNEFFTHVFIDEAGQLMEPESDIALGFVDSSTAGQVIMAGDPQQLGPVLRSSHAISYGLQVSYLERLMHTSLYARNEREYKEYGGYNPLLVTMLEESYRSHPDILRFPSDMFYFSRVVCRFAMEGGGECRPLTEWSELPRKGFPVIFNGVRGEEMREQNSPSWYNSAEVVQVAGYLRKLYDLGLSPEEVGIIAPYKKQVEKIRFLLTVFGLDLCKIGSVEEFQGQERRAIIISTVRSSDAFVDCDIKYNLGFISNPKRLNVAVTRSRELLIVVGNPHILSTDFFWHSFVCYCVKNDCYIGCDLPLSFSQSRREHAT